MFHKYPKIKILGDEENADLLINPNDTIIIEEKIDGANFRFMIKDSKIIFGSRTNNELGTEDDDIGGNWKRCVEFIKKRKAQGAKFNEGLIYYGECCVKHSMDYDWENIPPFLGFDIFDLKSGEFLDYIKRTSLFTDAYIKIVPFIKKVKAKEIKELTDEDVPESVYANPKAEDKQAEGIVLKNYSTQTFAKYVRPKFKELNMEVFGGSKKWATDDAGRIVATYCTNARIDKIIFKLIDEDQKLEMKLMEHLPKRVTEDIYEEHWRDICFSNWSVNFKDVRKKINTRCVNILKQVIVNNSLNK